MRNNIFSFRYASLALLIFLFTKISAQYSEYNSSNIYSKLQGLNTLAAVLYIGVTPADENQTLLTYLLNEKHYRTGFLSLTRGESMENKYRYEQGIELGLVHTAEQEIESKITGVENFYATAYDAGSYIDEQQVYKNWDINKVLSDIVWVIRTFQPDVIITNYSASDSTNGETAVCTLLAKKAFELAADSSAFSEQLKYGAICWKAKRLLLNCNDENYFLNKRAALYPNNFNAATGLSNTNIVEYAKQYEKSMYDENDSAKINASENFGFISGDSAFTSMMDGVDTTWLRLNKDTATIINATMNGIIQHYNFLHPDSSVKDLLKIYNLLSNLKTNAVWKESKLKNIQTLILLCCGLQINVFSNQQYAVPGDSLAIYFSIINKSGYKVVLENYGVNFFDTTLNILLPPLEEILLSKKIFIDSSKQATQPYWLSNRSEKPFMYKVQDQYSVGKSNNDAEYTADINLLIDSTDFWFTKPVKFSISNNNELQSVNVSTIVPLIVSLRPGVILTNVIPGNEVTENPSILLRFKTNFSSDSVNAKIKIYQLGLKTSSNKKNVALKIANKVFEQDSIINVRTGVIYSISIPFKSLSNFNKAYLNSLSASITISLNGKDKFYSSFLKTIDYNYLPEIGYYYRDVTKIIPDEIKTVGDSVGYVYDNGDWMPAALQQLGFFVKTFSQEDFVEESLKKYDAVFIGMHLKNVEQYLEDSYDSLLKYVSNGGVLIFLNGQLNLHKPFEISSMPQNINAESNEVKINKNNAALFNYPNTIAALDFAEWKNNFTYFAFRGFDSTFQTPLVFHNAQTNKNVSNSLLIKNYGKGKFVFVGLSLPSQIASGEASAYKLLSNLVAIFSANNNQWKNN